MGVIRDFTAWPRGPLAIAIGVFDGVHIGHRALIEQTAARADELGGKALAATFEPLPIQALAPGAPPSALSDVDGRVRLLQEAGADDVVVFSFTKEFAALGPEEFVRRLAAAGQVRRILVGEDFQFGRDRAGDVRTLQAAGTKHGFEVEVAAPVKLDGEVVSSTRIRNALLAGDVEGAAGLLGRPYAVTGTVVHGAKRGRALGFPTVNLAVPAQRLLPRDGIYAMTVRVRDNDVAAAASLGVRPTFGGGDRTLEAYLLDWKGDVYGDRLEAAFIKRLRDELRFASATELSEQIARDVEQTRAALRSRP
ncbi:MAG TPA: bifunctional riboflavin kinase/FAD synthetase [Candidatus Limnocylindria bacterium]|nr:bifunctional riboflavin kinase/FAD synthetase [Candidatus Limnocylindria bacterium]